MSLIRASKKIALVTGANTGMGYQTALALASRNFKVIMADKDDQTESRRNIIEETHNDDVIVRHLDLSSLQFVKLFVEELEKEEKRLDAIINNAGVFCMKFRSTCDGLDGVMQVNHFGPLLLTDLLTDLLKKSGEGRIIFVTSSGAFVHNLTVETLLKPTKCAPEIVSTFLNYYNSKLCNMITSKMFAKRLRKFNVTSNCLHPGMTNTQFMVRVSEEDGYFEKTMKGMTKTALRYTTNDAKRSASLSVFLASSRSVKDVSGEFFVNYQVHKQPRVLENEQFCNRIWKQSQKLIGMASDT